MKRHVPLRLYLTRDLDLIYLYLNDRKQFKKDMLECIRAYLEGRTYKIYPPVRFQSHVIDRRVYQFHLLLDIKNASDQAIMEFLQSVTRNRINSTCMILFRESLARPFILPYLKWDAKEAIKAPPEPKEETKRKKQKEKATPKQKKSAPEKKAKEAKIAMKEAPASSSESTESASSNDTTAFLNAFNKLLQPGGTKHE
jgi:thiol:disulfide interchange protein